MPASSGTVGGLLTLSVSGSTSIYRSTITGGPYSKLVSSPVAGTSYTDQTVQPGDEYYYVVTAVGTDGQESASSNQVAASTP